MNAPRYHVLKIPFKELNLNDYGEYTLHSTSLEKYYVPQGDSLLIDQIRQLRVSPLPFKLHDVIFVQAKKNPKKDNELKQLIINGFMFNGHSYYRFGKSNSQAKEGITAFVIDELYDELWKRSMLDLTIQECVIAKFESQRNLIFSSCVVHQGKLPYIVIVDEYKKTLHDQHIKYATQVDKELIDETTGEKKTFKQRVINDGISDIDISPFDGCGVHTHSFGVTAAQTLGIYDYVPISLQVRMPCMKGLSVEFPIQEWCTEHNVKYIFDVFGKAHKIEDIDCIWNISMWKAYKLFKEAYGNEGWKQYLGTVEKYNFKLGIAKYAHHTSHINIMARMNFQYLQCLDLWNPKYIESFKNKESYDILNPENDGKIIKLAKYQLELFKKIINGDKFYSLKYLGINDTDEYEAVDKYVEAILINEEMLYDPVIRQYIYRKLSTHISQMKYGKIYSNGFYHTACGDLIAYMQYATQHEVVGCLNAHEFHCQTLGTGKFLSFRSPLMCPSEVNEVDVVCNNETDKWLSHFKNQDIVMVNMYDLTMPQQGGMDFDGDSVYLCNNPIVLESKIDKTIVVDIEDKATSKSLEYNAENIATYELSSRDSRIGEITNVAMSIINQYTEEEKWKKINADNISLLRLYQGKEIDSLKTGLRWHLNKSLRKHLKKLPYFILYNYPKKLELYRKRIKLNKAITGSNEDRYEYNCYHSPSPLNELCEYVDKWEKSNFLFHNYKQQSHNVHHLVVNKSVPRDNPVLYSRIKHILHKFTSEYKETLVTLKQEAEPNYQLLTDVLEKYKQQILELDGDVLPLANYVIDISYSTASISKVFVWKTFGDYILSNIAINTPRKKKTKIIETTYDFDGVLEFLGKKYIMLEENVYAE